jgi:hypothetical protein
LTGRTLMDGDFCIANLGPLEQRKRRRFGFAALVLGLVLAGVLLVTGAGRLARLGLFLPFWMAGLGYFQARGKT